MLDNINSPYNLENENLTVSKVVIESLKRNWYFFVFTILVAVFTAYLFNNYSPKTYEVTATVLLQNANGSYSSGRMIGYNLGGYDKNMYNEINILNSYTLAERTLEKLDFEVSYHSYQSFLDVELYDESPFEVVYDKKHQQLTGRPIKVSFLTDSLVRIQLEADEYNTYNFDSKELSELIEDYIKVDTVIALNSWIACDYFRFKVQKTNRYDSNCYGMIYYFKFKDLVSLSKYFKTYWITPINQDASIVEIHQRSRQVNKTIDFLNKLSAEFIQYELDMKNRMATQTIDFLNQQILEIQDTLKYTKQAVQLFKEKYQLYETEVQVEELLKQEEKAQKKISNLKFRITYYEHLQKALGQDGEISMITAEEGRYNHQLLRILRDLNVLYEYKSSLEYLTTKQTLHQQQIDQQIVAKKKLLHENIHTTLRGMSVQLRTLEQQIEDTQQQLGKYPQLQRKLYRMEMEARQLDYRYTKLLSQRANMQLTKVSNFAENEIVDVAGEHSVEQVFPQVELNYVIAVLVAILIPIGFFFGKEHFRNKVRDWEDLQNYLDKGIFVGGVLSNRREAELVAYDHPKSAVAESFRSLRTNLEFVNLSNEKVMVLVTSHFPGEGKTFISKNLALSYAAYGRKTLLLGFDLRKPKIYDDFGMHNRKGLSTYLTNKHTFEEVVQRSEKHNLDIIMAGPIPPNPSEIIASQETIAFFKMLRTKYDYIIIDTAPVGLVTDALIMMNLVDASIFVCRQGYSQKRIFAETVNDCTRHGFKNVCIAINDVKPEPLEQNGIRYGYYSDDDSGETRSFWQKLLERGRE